MTRDRLAGRLDDIRTRFDVPGIAVALDFPGEKLSLGVGVSSTVSCEAMSPDKRMPISCVMKVLVAWLILHADSAGKLSIEDDIAVYVPQILAPGESATGISLWHLLTHTAGYIEPQENSARWGFDLDRFLAFFPKRKQAFQPGSLWSYTHTGHVLLQLVLEKIYGKSAQDIVCELLFDPLGFQLEFLSEGKAGGQDRSALHIKMPRTNAFEPMRPPQETGFLRYSISDAVLSAHQMAVLASALAGGHVSKLPHLEAARKRLLTSAIKLPVYSLGPQGERMPRKFCHGVADYGTYKGINGSYVGSTCAMRFFDEKHLGMAAMVNAYEPHVRDVAIEMLGRPFGQAASDGDEVDDIRFEDLERLEGQYEGLMLGAAEADIVRDGDSLTCSVRFKRGPGMSGRFVTDANGRLALAEGTRDASMALAKSPDGAPYLMVSTSAFRKVPA